MYKLLFFVAFGVSVSSFGLSISYLLTGYGFGGAFGIGITALIVLLVSMMGDGVNAM